MEPAVERREHLGAPLSPGTEIHKLQWSPPSNSGEHAGVVAVGADLDLAAMEPAVGRWEHWHCTPPPSTIPGCRNGARR
ncbi:MAG: hypothetical protein ACLQFR_06150 [Streptosporangiaceae bacterium]|jgi:hypothetical protein